MKRLVPTTWKKIHLMAGTLLSFFQFIFFEFLPDGSYPWSTFLLQIFFVDCARVGWKMKTGTWLLFPSLGPLVMSLTTLSSRARARERRMVDRQHVRMRKIMKEISCRSIPSYGHPIGNLFSYEFGMTDRRKIPNLGAFSSLSYYFCGAQEKESWLYAFFIIWVPRVSGSRWRWDPDVEEELSCWRACDRLSLHLWLAKDNRLIIPRAPMKGFWWHLHVGSFQNLVPSVPFLLVELLWGTVRAWWNQRNYWLGANMSWPYRRCHRLSNQEKRKRTWQPVRKRRGTDWLPVTGMRFQNGEPIVPFLFYTWSFLF